MTKFPYESKSLLKAFCADRQFTSISRNTVQKELQQIKVDSDVLEVYTSQLVPGEKCQKTSLCYQAA